MPYLIATDEAGLGPNLGPLVVTATLWHLPGGASPEDLFDLLADSVVCSAGKATGHQIAMADSKQLYKPGGSLRQLERGVFASLAALGRHATEWRTLFDTLDPTSAEYRDSIPWYSGFDEPLPIDTDTNELADSAERFIQVCDRARVRPCDVRSRVVYPGEFNELLESCGGKGALLSHVTLSLVADLAAPLEEPLSVVCDKHGGRNRYADLLAAHFPGAFVEIHGEGRGLSAYALGAGPRRMTFCFRTRAESVLAVGLSSMFSKYLRELSMRPFNRFWRERVEGLRPTAGYPQDAKRFRKDVAAVRQSLGIEDEVFWRAK